MQASTSSPIGFTQFRNFYTRITLLGFLLATIVMAFMGTLPVQMAYNVERLLTMAFITTIWVLGFILPYTIILAVACALGFWYNFQLFSISASFEWSGYAMLLLAFAMPAKAFKKPVQLLYVSRILSISVINFMIIFQHFHGGAAPLYALVALPWLPWWRWYQQFNRRWENDAWFDA